MSEFVVLEAGGDGIFPARDARAGRDVARDAVRRGEVVRLVIRDGREVRRDVLAEVLQVGAGECLDARRNRLVAQDDHRRAEFPRDVHRLDRRVEAVLDARRREHHARAVAVTAEDRDVQVALLLVRRHARARPAALHIDDHHRHLRHRGPAERLGLQRNSRPARSRHRDAAAVAAAERHRDRRDFILGLDERAAVFRQLAAQQFHHLAPRRDRVACAEAHARRDDAEGERLVAAHHHLRRAGVLGMLEMERLHEPLDLVPVAAVETIQRVLHDRRILSAEALLDQLRELRHIQIKHPRDEPECVDIFPLVAPRPADGLDGEARNGDAHMAISPEEFLVRLHMIRIIKHDAAALQRTDVVRVAVVVKAQQHIRLIARAQHFAGADAHLENRSPARDGGRDRHERHHILLAAPREPREEAADGLDAVLRIARNADDAL